MHTKKLFIGGDFNGPIGTNSMGYYNVHEDFGFGGQKQMRNFTLDFARAYDLVMANLSFPREDYQVSFRSMGVKV